VIESMPSGERKKKSGNNTHKHLRPRVRTHYPRLRPSCQEKRTLRFLGVLGVSAVSLFSETEVARGL